MKQSSHHHSGDNLNAEQPRLEMTRDLPDSAGHLFPATMTTLLAQLGRRYTAQRDALLGERKQRQAAWNAGAAPGFEPETADIREGDWRVAPIPEDLRDRRVEITGPVNRKMVINALNSAVPGCSWPISRILRRRAGAT